MYSLSIRSRRILPFDLSHASTSLSIRNEIWDLSGRCSLPCSLFWRHRQSGTMPNVKNENAVVDDDKQNTIGSAVATAVKQFTDRLIQGESLLCQQGAFGMVRQGLDLCSRPGEPCPCGLRRALLPDVAVHLSEIGFCFRCDDDATAQPSRSRSSNTSSTGRPIPFFAWARPRRMLAIMSSCSATS